jgi:hypothetical protein
MSGSAATIEGRILIPALVERHTGRYRHHAEVEAVGSAFAGTRGRRSWNEAKNAGAGMGTHLRLSPSMTEIEFDHGYRYATELRDFAAEIGTGASLQARHAALL